MTQVQQRVEALAKRVGHTILILGYQEFTAGNVANAMHGADKYDVLFALHRLRNEGVVEQLNSRDDVFRDRWRRVRPSTPYLGTETVAQAVGEAL
jgi:hypothetical protein